MNTNRKQPCLIKLAQVLGSGNFLPYQYSVTVNDSVEPVSNGEDGAVFKLVPNSLLDEAISPEREGNTTPEHRGKKKRKTVSSYRPLGRDFTQHGTMAHQQRGMCSSRHTNKEYDSRFTKVSSLF